MATPVKALKAELDPKYINPSSMSMDVHSMSAYTGDAAATAARARRAPPDTAPDATSRDGPVARESISAPTRGRERAYPRERQYPEYQEQQAEPAGRAARYGLEEQADGLPVGLLPGKSVTSGSVNRMGSRYRIPVTPARDYGEHDGPRNRALRVRYLLAHAGDHAVPRQCVRGAQEADEPGPARWPAMC